MKKILSALLILTLLVVGALLFTSCDEMSEKKMKKDPMTALNEAENNTMSAFFSDEAGAGKVLNKAQKKGSFNITFTTKELFGGDLTKLSETVFVDSKNNAFVSDTFITLCGEDLAARIFVDQSGFALSSDAIFGNADTLVLNFDSMTEKLKGSALADIMEMTDEDVDALIKGLDSMKEALNAKPTDSVKDMKEWYDKLAKLTKETITTETVEDEDGKKTEYIVVSHTINNDVIEELIDLVLEEIKADGTMSAEDIAEMETSIDALLVQVLGTIELDLTEKTYIVPKNNTIAKITCTGTGKLTASNLIPEADSANMELDLSCTFSDNQIAAILDIDMADQTIKASFVIDKEQKDDKTTYTFALAGGTKTVTVDILTGSYVYDKAAEEITVEAEIMQDESTSMTLTAKASYKVTKNEIFAKVLSVSAGDETFEFGTDNELSLTIKAEDSIPERPADAKDMMDLSSAELEELGQKVESSRLAKVIEILEKKGLKQFRKSGMTLYLPEDFKYSSTAGTDFKAIYESADGQIAVFTIEEKKKDLGRYNTLEKYINIILENNDTDQKDLQRTDNGVPYFELTARGSDSTLYCYIVAFYEDDDGFWMVQFAAPNRGFNDVRDDILKWVDLAEVS